MPNRVNVNVTARDLTRPELARLRRSFEHFGRDINRLVGSNTRRNFLQLRESTNAAARQLRALRGSIPDDEFRRMNHQLRQAQATLSRGFGRVGNVAMTRMLARLREVDEAFVRLNRDGRIRVQVRTDTSALRRADAQLAAWRRAQQRQAARIPVRPDVNRRSWTTGLRGALTQPIRMSGRILGGVLSDGLGQGIIGGFRSAGPIGIAVLSAVILAALGALGAAMAGLLVLAFGGAFVALGAVFASQSEVIQRNWKTATKNMGEDMKRAAEPLVPVIHNVIHELESAVDVLSVKMRQFFAEASPQLTSFFDALKASFRRFGEVAWQPMTDAFRHFLDAFGPQWDGFMVDLGESFGALGRTVSEHSTEIAMGLRVVLHIIVLFIDLVNLLANAWVQGIRIMTYAWGLFLKAMSLAVGGFLTAIDTMLAAIEPFAKVLGMGEAVSAARRNIADWGENVQQGLSDAGQQAMDFGKSLDRANRKRRLEVDIASYQSRLAIARADLKKTADKKARAKLQADITDLNNKIASAQRQLAALNGTTATTYVDVWTRNKTYGGNSVTGARRHGGVVGAAASGGVRSNMTLVGEGGPEVVDLPTGSRVRSNPDSRRVMGGSGGGGGPVVIEIRSSGSAVDDMLLEIFRKAVHVRGGDVQIAVMGR